MSVIHEPTSPQGPDMHWDDETSRFVGGSSTQEHSLSGEARSVDAGPTTPTQFTGGEADYQQEVEQPDATPGKKVEPILNQLEREQPKGRWSLRTKVLAIAALIGVGVAGGVAAAASSGGKRSPAGTAHKDGAPQPGDVQVTIKGGNGATVIPKNPGHSSPSQVEISSANTKVGNSLDTVGEAAEDPGNVKYSVYPGLKTIDIEWNGTGVRIPELVAPGTVINGYKFTETDTGTIVLEQLAALMSLPSDSPDFTKVLDAFTDNPQVKTYVQQQKAKIDAQAPNPGNDQVILFDTSGDKAEFADADETDADGNKLHTLSQGMLYLRYLNKDCVFTDGGVCTVNPDASVTEKASFQDTRAYSPQDSMPVQDRFHYSYSTNDTGNGVVTAKIENLQFGVNS